MSGLQCEYHPRREALDKCHKCNRMICLEDKQISQSCRFSSQIQSKQPGIYCSICYLDRLEKDNVMGFSRNIALLISVIIIGFFGGFYLLLRLIIGENSFISYFFLGFMGLTLVIIWLGYGISSFFSGDSTELNRARKARQKLVDSADLEKNTVFCMTCGTENDIIEKYCNDCGDSLHPVKK